jgi:hypothetical protein
VIKLFQVKSRWEGQCEAVLRLQLDATSRAGLAYEVTSVTVKRKLGRTKKEIHFTIMAVSEADARYYLSKLAGVDISRYARELVRLHCPTSSLD